MASFGEWPTVKLWTCCGCGEMAMPMTSGDCRQCDHARCINCDVKSQVVTEDGKDGENKKKAESSAMASSIAVLGENETSSSNIANNRRLVSVRDRLSESYVLQAISIATGIEHYPIFVLQEQSDADLISRWNGMLPELSDLCLRDYSQLKITSIHLFRVGTDELSSQPTIIINTAEPLEPNEKMQIQWTLAAAANILSPTCPSSVGRTTSPRLQVLFRQNRLRRSFATPTLPPICQPRNRQFSPNPGTGASIGIAGSFEDTATLGCYLRVDEITAVLTVDHLIPVISSNPAITHISQQDQLELLLSALSDVKRLVIDGRHTCELCGLWPTLSTDIAQHFVKESLDTIFDGFETVSKRLIENSCPFYMELKAMYKSPEWHQVHEIAKTHAQSGSRFRISGCEKREMDWALFRGMTQNILYQNDAALSSGSNKLHVQSLKPGALVRSLGRTSGHQMGQISTTTSAIFHDSYATQEWTIIKRRETPLDEWIEGGIGVEGDSGALIVDEDTEAVYGMLWGRSGDGPATVTIFTPMQEILLDICERSNADRVQLLRGQEMPRPNQAEALDTSVARFPLSVSSEENSVPVLLSLEGQSMDIVLEEGMASFSITRQSSADTRHPHSFERYRGRDSTGRSVPRSTPQTIVENAESSQWPGVHTYLRYAVAPEQE